MKYRKQLVLW